MNREINVRDVVIVDNALGVVVRKDSKTFLDDIYYKYIIRQFGGKEFECFYSDIIRVVSRSELEYFRSIVEPDLNTKKERTAAKFVVPKFWKDTGKNKMTIEFYSGEPTFD